MLTSPKISRGIFLYSESVRDGDRTYKVSLSQHLQMRFYGGLLGPIQDIVSIGRQLVVTIASNEYNHDIISCLLQLLFLLQVKAISFPRLLTISDLLVKLSSRKQDVGGSKEKLRKEKILNPYTRTKQRPKMMKAGYY